MYRIIIKGEAKTDYPNLKELDGISCQDEFTEYFDSRFSFKNDVIHGYLHFKYDNNKLWSITSYTSKRELTEDELEVLEDYTTGQWSDGIGEGFEQEPCYYTNTPYMEEDGSDEDEDFYVETNSFEVYISPCFPGQKTIVEQHLIKI